MLNIDIKTIKQEEHRYQTLGDYWEDEKGTHIRVTNLKNPDSEFLVVLHELVEMYITKRKGIDEPKIMAFDIEFEKERADGKWDENAEPGDDPRAPYKTEHCLSEIIERLVARELGVDWKQHCEYQQYEPKVLNGMEEEVYNKG